MKHLMTLNEILKSGTELLKEAGIETAVTDALVLLSHITGRDKASIYTHGGDFLESPARKKYFDCIKKRAKKMPVAYITGVKEFMSLDFSVRPGVLIPRPETELLVETVMEYLGQSCVSLEETSLTETSRAEKPNAEMFPVETPRVETSRVETSPIEILDIGTGSGCIAVSLAYYLKKCFITATDILEKALDIARLNSEKNKVADRLEFLQGSMFEPLQGRKFDVIVSNPPYIPSGEISCLEEDVKEYEPDVALDGGEDGLFFYREITGEAPGYLKPNGLLALEVGQGQADAVIRMMKDIFIDARVYRDIQGIPRVVSGRMYTKNINIC